MNTLVSHCRALPDAASSFCLSYLLFIRKHTLPISNGIRAYSWSSELHLNTTDLNQTAYVATESY